MSRGLERVLIVAFRFPPYTAVGGKRWAKLSKYLARQGVEVHVLTVPWGANTPEAMQDVTHPNIHIHRIPALVLTRLKISTPGPYTVPERARNRFCRTKLYREHIANQYWSGDAVLWGPALIPSLAWLAGKTGSQAIIATGGPFWTGYWVARAKPFLPRVPIIQEFRDPWLELPERLLDRQGGRERVQHHERSLIASADALVTVTEGLSELVRGKAGDTPVHTIPNGYDPEDLPPRSAARPRPFRLIHGGNLAVGREEPLRAFLRAAEALFDEMPGLELVFRGRFPRDVLAEYSHLEDSGVLSVLPAIPAPEFMQELDDSFAALQFNAEQFPYLVSTKIYEYGASGRPVLSVNYGGEIDVLIRKHELGWSANANGSATVKEGLQAVHSAWKEDPAYTSCAKNLGEYEYARIAEKYRNLLGSLT